MRSDISKEAMQQLNEHNWITLAFRPAKGRKFQTLFRDGSGDVWTDPGKVHWDDPCLIGWRYVNATNKNFLESTSQSTYPKDSLDKRLDGIFGVSETLAERGARYGDFAANAAVSQRIKDAMFYDAALVAKLSPIHIEALTMIAQKIARILNGDPNYADNWHDIQGYAKLVEDRLPKDSTKD